MAAAHLQVGSHLAVLGSKDIMMDAQSPADSAVVDTVALEGLRALRRPGQPDPVARLVDIFIDETETRLARLGDAVARRDLAETHRLAHAQKGSSGTIGANEMRSIAQRLEVTARAGSTERIDELMQALDSAFARSRQILEDLKRRDAAN
jgi:HPt (histidine-containing phosphotransfer) domain-containing protein